MSTYTPGDFTEAITAEVVERMTSKEWTVEELAARAGMGAKALRNRLEGRAPWTVHEALDLMPAALECTLPDLMGWPDEDGELEATRLRVLGR